MFRTSLQITLVLCAAFAVSAQVPKFKDYPAGKAYNGRNVKPVITKNDRLLRTRIKWASETKRNFAGEYVLSTFGCGTECLNGFAFNVRTGRVVRIPISICCFPRYITEPIEGRLNSRLIIFRGLRNEAQDEFSGDKDGDVHYYELKDGKFRYIKTIKQP